MNLLAQWEQRVVPWSWVWAAVIAVVGACVALLPIDWVILLVGGTALAILTLVRPAYGIYALVFAVPFGSVRQFQLSGINVNACDACVALVVASWLGAMVVQRRIVVPHLPLLLHLIGFIFVLVLSWLAALSLTVSLKETLKWVQLLLVYLFIGSTFDEDRVRRTMTLVLIAGVLASLLGIYQFFGRVGPDGFLWHTPVGLFMRAYGTFQQPNPFGGYVGMVAPIAYGLWLVSFGIDKGQVPLFGMWRFVTHTTLYAVLTGLMVVAILMTWSRGAILGFLAAFVAINMRRSRRVAAAFVVVMVLLIGLGALQLLPEVITQRFLDFLPFLSIPDVNAVELNPVNFALVQRLAHWTAGWDMFAAHPWTGVGIGNYPVVYPLYAPPAWPDAMGHAHNYYLNMAAEAGLAGLFAYLMLWAVIFWQTLRATYRLRGYALGIALGVFGVLVHLSVHNLVDNLYVHNMYLHIAILLGCVAALMRSQTTLGSTSGCGLDCADRGAPVSARSGAHASD